jgi:hypothetical protein
MLEREFKTIEGHRLKHLKRHKKRVEKRLKKGEPGTYSGYEKQNSRRLKARLKLIEGNEKMYEKLGKKSGKKFKMRWLKPLVGVAATMGANAEMQCRENAAGIATCSKNLPLIEIPFAEQGQKFIYTSGGDTDPYFHRDYWKHAPSKKRGFDSTFSNPAYTVHKGVDGEGNPIPISNLESLTSYVGSSLPFMQYIDIGIPVSLPVKKNTIRRNKKKRDDEKKKLKLYEDVVRHHRTADDNGR